VQRELFSWDCAFYSRLCCLDRPIVKSLKICNHPSEITRTDEDPLQEQYKGPEIAVLTSSIGEPASLMSHGMRQLPEELRRCVAKGKELSEALSTRNPLFSNLPAHGTKTGRIQLGEELGG
jgi:hypothetical protein